MSNYSERIRSLRREKRLSQEIAAKNIGIARSTYATYEAGTREPGIETLQRIADFFGVSIDYLLGITDNPSQQEDVIETLNFKTVFEGKASATTSRSLESLGQIVALLPNLKPQNLRQLRAIIDDMLAEGEGAE